MSHPRSSEMLMTNHRSSAGTVGFAAAVLLFAQSAEAAPIYLNFQNITVSLGPTMAAEPFADIATVDALPNIIDAPTAASSENHTSGSSGTHVWVSGGSLQLAFDFGVEYDLTTVHFWNYFAESFDVDNVTFSFFNSLNAPVGSLSFSPALGGGGSNPIFAESIALAFPSNVRFVTALLTGTNNQVDFNNIGFTAELSDLSQPVPEPATLALVGGSLAAGLLRRRVRRAKA